MILAASAMLIGSTVRAAEVGPGAVPPGSGTPAEPTMPASEPGEDDSTADATGADPQGSRAEATPQSKPERPIPVQILARGWDGEEVSLNGEEPIGDVPPTAQLVLSSEEALVDLRIRLRDEAGSLVPSNDRATVGQGTLYELRPRDPLLPGTTYRLLIDGQRSPFAKDAAGQSYAPRTLTFRTAGEKPPPPPPAKKRRGRR